MVTNAIGTTELVQTGETCDRLGRKITPAVRREELVAAWRQSGLTQAEFARQESVRPVLSLGDHGWLTIIAPTDAP